MRFQERVQKLTASLTRSAVSMKKFTAEGATPVRDLDDDEDDDDDSGR